MKNFRWTEKIFMFMAGSMYLLVTFWLFWPCTPLVIQESIKILNKDKVVQQGGELIYEVCYDKRVETQISIVKHLVNSYMITYSPVDGNLLYGKGKVKRKMPIPLSADLGKYKMWWTTEVPVNPLRKTLVGAWSEEFEVVAK